MKKIFGKLAIMAMMGLLSVITSCNGLIDAVMGTEDQPVNNTDAVVHITGVSISGDGIVNAAATMSVGTTLQLTATVTPSTTTETTLKWTSNDESVLTVSETGLLTAVKAGTVTVKVSSAIDAGVWAQMIVNVTDGSINVNQDAVDQSHAQSRG